MSIKLRLDFPAFLEFNNQQKSFVLGMIEEEEAEIEALKKREAVLVDSLAEVKQQCLFSIEHSNTAQRILPIVEAALNNERKEDH